VAQSLAFRVSRWSAAHPDRLDAAVAASVAAVCVPAGAALAGWAGLLLSAALAGPLVVRRRFPVVVATWTAGVSVLQMILVPIPLPADVAVPVALYTVAAHVPARGWRLAALAVTAGGGTAAGFRWSTPPSYWANALAAAAVLVTLGTLVWVVGNLVRGREANLGEVAAARRQRERVAAAREIHDIVAHSLAVVIVQADGGRYAAVHAEPWGREQAAEVLHTIGGAARSALGEVRGLIDMLHGEPVAPASLERLAGAVRAAGLPVRLDARRAVLDGLPTPVHTAVLRIVQESLTNVLKHGGRGATAEVAVRRTTAAVTVRVASREATANGDGGAGIGGPGSSDTGTGDTEAGSTGTGSTGTGAGGVGLGGGHGLAGMRERVGELGGTLTAGPRPGGFLVEATIPAVS